MSKLCVQCNLCCDGSIFATVPISEKDRRHLDKGIEVITKDGELRMPLPCPKLGSDGHCTCYETRPEVCRSYACKLLTCVDAGEITEDHALTIVAEVRSAQQKAMQLAIDAQGQSHNDVAGQNIFEVFRSLNTKIKDGGAYEYAARRAKIHRNFYVELARFHFQSNFWR